jgi:hypothetical protein
MAKITNKLTGKSQQVSDEELKLIEENPATSKLFLVDRTPEPKEVKALKDKTETA